MLLFIFKVLLNWIFKLFFAFLMYLLANWLGVPEWTMIAMVAIGACETKFELQLYE